MAKQRTPLMDTHTLSYTIFLLFLLIRFNSAWHLYKSSDHTRKTTDLFERLKYHEIISFSHNQFHAIDSTKEPVYPTNGRLSFDAFGRHYSLLIRKNRELFSDTFHTELHRWNKTTKQVDKSITSTDIPDCRYTAEVESDPSDTGHGVFSACKGRGIRGWVHAFGETIVIRPKLHLTDVSFKGSHRINDHHIVYRYQDLDRSDYPHNKGNTCGHVHSLTELLEKHHLERKHNAEDDKIDLDVDNTEHAKATHEWRRRRLTSDTTRYVELVIVNDPAMVAIKGNNLQELVEKTISIVETLQTHYLNADFGSTVGTIQIVLSAIINLESFGELMQPSIECLGSGTAPSLYISSNSKPSDYCTVDYADYLSKFDTYRKASLKEYDNAQLFSYYDFYDTVIGYASLPGMCITGRSGGIEQCTYDDEYNAAIVAHMMGHNFNMQHDGIANSCDPENYIMASVGNPNYKPTAFSSCSIGYTQSFFAQYTKTLRCLDDKPTSGQYAVCRNGFVEEGEYCDCGASQCATHGDPCCDGSTCNLYASYECSNNDVCCQECQIKEAGSVCNELDIDNTCDIEEEVCDGTSPECPPDLKHVEGTTCLSDSGNSFGYCYAGSCKSLDTQCQLYGAATGTSYSVAPSSCADFPAVQWQVDETRCASSIKCYRANDDQCLRLNGEEPDNGIPCNQSLSPSQASQCVDGVCEYSSDIFTYRWTVSPWSACNSSCKLDSGLIAGYQQRIVECTLQNGTAVDDESLCQPDFVVPRPSSSRICNDYVCDFCAMQPWGKTICGDHGDCSDELKVCDCHSGWSGARCDVSPSLNFSAIVSHLYQNISSQHTIAQRIDPCGNGTDSYDSDTKTETFYYQNVSDLTQLLIGSTVGVRWTSGGAISLLAVGLQEVDAESGEAVTDNYEFPLYVGTSLAYDNSKCDDDPCYENLQCNDFTFKIAESLIPSTYKLLIRFNNEFAIESPILTITCNENLCAPNGNCSSDGSRCICAAGYSGDSCAVSLCHDWSFTRCDKDEYGNCGSTGSLDYKSKCFNSTCSLDNMCGESCSNPNFDGEYCELPRDFCSTLLTEDACNDASLSLDSCIWSDSRCLYKECQIFTNQQECESWKQVENNANNTNSSSYFVHENRWTTFCEWNSSDSYCNRITCGDETLPSCSNGAVRRPLFDISSDLPIPICRAWFCDCSTSSAEGYWTETAPSTLLELINSSYNYITSTSALTSRYIADDASLDLFTCSSCSLECQNGATHSESECTECSDDCPIEIAPYRGGKECSQVFWIADFRISIDSSVYIHKQSEVESVLIQDLAYFLSTSTDRISIWQIQPDGDSSIVFFRYLFDTSEEDEAQLTGGGLMNFAYDEVRDSTSTAVRGFIMQYTDSTYSLDWCIPNKEECDPTADPSVDPTFDTTIIPSSIISSTDDGTNVNQDSAGQVHMNSSLWNLVAVLSIIDGVILIGCLVYIYRKVLERTKIPGNASWAHALRQFEKMDYIVVVLELSDLITDYVFAADLILNASGTATLGWISLMLSVFGLIMFYTKYILMRKLWGFQVAKYRKQLKECNDVMQRAKIMIEIRHRMMDIDVISLLNGCIEDIPQTCIVLIILTNIGFGYVSILSLSLSVASFLMKSMTVLMSKFGCRDVDDPLGEQKTEDVMIDVIQ
eukprot:544590_1